jgi:hypothetical protein
MDTGDKRNTDFVGNLNLRQSGHLLDNFQFFPYIHAATLANFIKFVNY